MLAYFARSRYKALILDVSDIIPFNKFVDKRKKESFFVGAGNNLTSVSTFDIDIDAIFKRAYFPGKSVNPTPRGPPNPSLGNKC